MENSEQTNNKRSKEEVLVYDKNKKMRNDLQESDKMIKKKLLDKDTQLLIINKIRGKNEGPYMYISYKWYVHWEGYCLGLRAPPGQIDNSDLFQEDGNLRTELVAEKDYRQLPLNAWKYLESWYGVKDRSFITPEKVVNLKFHLFIVNKPSKDSYSFTMSPDATVYDFQAQLLSVLALSLKTHNLELWLLNSQNHFFIEKLTSSSTLIIRPSLLEQGDRYAKRIDASTISQETTIADCLARLSTEDDHEFYLAVHISKKQPAAAAAAVVSRKPIGLCGLQNLGNSCYMNSAIQCLSNTPQLTRYFLSGKYKQNINRTSVLGLKGTLAEAYASLLRNIWKPNQSNRFSISPKDFKNTVEEFNEQFGGYLQQDSQEFLGSLLDGLHEDLNKVLKKPYIESSDSDEDISDVEMANKSWNYHKSRDDSVIVDLFQGQYKSRLVCDVCKKVSVTFDTFMYLSLPLPVEAQQEINVVYVPYLPSERMLSMSIQLNKEAKVKNLIQEIENNTNKTPSPNNKLMVTKLENGKISKIFDHEDAVSLIQTKDIIYIYQLPCSVVTDDQVIFPVYCSTTTTDQEPTQFGYPFLLVLDKQETDLYHHLVYHLERYCNVKLFEEDTAATGEQPMTPLKDLFTMRLFDTDHISMYPFEFPLLDDTTTFTWATNDTIHQGQGMVLQWDFSRALEIFGSSNEGINTEAWFDYDKVAPSRRKKRQVTLEDCLNEYTHEENLCGQDAWYCPRCKELQCASKKIDIWKLPDIMVIHLKRFSQVRRWGNKVDTYVDFPLTDLDMTARVLSLEEGDQKLVYDLYAVDNHYGGMHGGHYTAFAKNIETSDWYEYDDTHVSKMSPENVNSNAAYLLFYKKRSC